MSKDLVLVKKENFGNVECDFYRKGKEVYMTRKQIGEALGYADPNDAIAKLHERNKARMDKFSVVDKLSTSFGEKETYLYTAKGVYEICRFSTKEKANEFYDFVYELLENLRKGELKIVQTSLENKKKIDAYYLNAESRLLREKRVGLDFVMKTFGHVLSKESLQTLAAASTQMITGTALIPKPELASKTYTASQITAKHKITSNAVGRLANEHNSKKRYS